MAQGTGERRRLTRSADFDAVYRKGRSRASRLLVVYTFAREDDGDPAARVGIAVSRKVAATAVARNRIKRRLRDAVEQLRPEIAADQDIVVIARPGFAEADREGLEWIVDELRPLVVAGGRT